ncbi:hypothetical protein DICPUDRAFT_159794 [Dictyostelium purpureum]|uniref:Uncharacterized protein n=1 Tax=Dictyostelium purpureum TaxID=5786 RepID=F1A500_DICPU|nr:uncharacterized protein DICPUDRAFT_159794 [Dictyostelium purpureum]EGC28726.1 hypothetical protein DICPUDRAFT_159794 [Dictyostelium purpureum]|eukprot:XP_003294744.1 hypothetical protein DICPUDRAFT_159794 [Dictyostelium purpureum]
MVKPRNNRKNKKINNQCDVPINFPANTETDEMEIEYKADPNEIFLLVPNSKMLKVNRALQVSGHYKLKLAALDLLDDHVSNKDLLSDLSHNQYASAINYQLNLALKCHGSVKYLNSVKDKASSLLTKMTIEEWGSSDATAGNRKFISDSLKLIVDPIAFPEKYCWEEVKDSIIILGKFFQIKNESISEFCSNDFRDFFDKVFLLLFNFLDFIVSNKDRIIKESVYFDYVEETEKCISLLFDLVYTCDDCRLYHMVHIIAIQEDLDQLSPSFKNFF